MKYLKDFKSVEDANTQGAVGLYSPHVSIISGKTAVNIYKATGDTFTCTFDDDGKIVVPQFINISPSAFTFESTGGNSTLYVTSNKGWSASTANGYVTLLPTTGVKGTTNITVTASSNSGTSVLNDVITIQGENVSASASTRQEGIELLSIDLSMVDVNGNALQARETSNCYVIKTTGDYEFPLVYGCGIMNGIVNASAYTQIDGTYTKPFYNYKNVQVVSPFIETDTNTQAVSGVTLYTDVTGFSIENITLVEKPLCKYLRFTVSSIPELGGNAMIAVKDGDGQIMWSWHIWAYPFTITTKAHTNTNNVTYNMMDVNLGWIKDANDSKHGTCPYYQWGRKDPMLRSGISKPVTGTWKITTCATSLGATIQNPNVFNAYETTNNNWWTNNGTPVSFYNYWDASETVARLVDKKVVKTIYDPCPVGFSIPCGNAFLGFSTSNGGTWQSGWTWDDRFFRACGDRGSASGGVGGVGSSGGYWLSASYSQAYARNLCFYSSDVRPQYNDNRANGFSVCPVAAV